MINSEIVSALESNHTVVTGNNRLSRHIHLQYARRQSAGGVNAWQTPHIVPWSAWLGDVWQRLSDAEESLHRRVLSQQEIRLLWERIISSSATTAFTANPPALARLAASSWRLMQQWGVAHEELTGAAYSPDHRAFIQWSAEFRAKLEAESWITADELPLRISEYIRSGDADHIRRVLGEAFLFAGFDELNPAQRNLLDALKSAGITVSEVSNESRINEAVRCAFPDDHDELVAAANWARKQVEAEPDSSVAVLIPDLQKRAGKVRRVFMDCLVPDWRSSAGNFQLPVNFSYGSPLADNGLVSTAFRVLGMGCRASEFADISLLMRSPYLAGAGEEEWQRAAAELEVREAGFVDIWPWSLAVLLDDKTPLFTKLLRDTPRWNERQSASGWAGEFAKLLKSWGWPGEHLPETNEYRAYQAWTGLLDDFVACDVVLGEVSAAKALGVLQSMAHEALFQAEGDPDAIQVMGLLEASGQSFDHLWVCGLTADAWPASSQPDPLIPRSVQQQHKMPNATPAETWRFNKAVMTAMLSGTPNPVVSWPTHRDDEKLQPAPIPVACSEKEADQACGAADDSNYPEQVRQQLKLTELNPDPAPAVPQGERVFGGSGLLAQQAQCPARAFVERRLGAKELRQAVSGIDAMTRGTLMHSVMERWYRKHPKQSELLGFDNDALKEAIHEIAEGVIDERYGKQKGVLGIVAGHEVERLTTNVVAFLETEKHRNSFEAVGFEDERKVLLGPNGAMELYLQLDRIDKIEGNTLVIDYKSSEMSPGRWAPPRPKDPQLPLYAVTEGAQGIAIAAISTGTASLKGVSDEETGARGVKAVEKQRSFDADDWDELVSQWKSSFDVLVAEFMAGDYRVNIDDLALAKGEHGLVLRTSGLEALDEQEVVE